MSTTLLEKVKILIKVIRILRNWHLYVKLYFHFVNDEHVILETRGGIKIKLRVNSTDLMTFTNVWILQDYYKQEFEIKNDDIIIDVGAHIGLFALFASQFCKNGKIYCFEPVKSNFEILLDNLKLNNITNVLPHNIAVSGSDGRITIYLNDDDAGHSMHRVSMNHTQVNSISLRNIIDSNNLQRCNFLKIDCEGEEYEIIKSLPSSYFDIIDKMCIECHFIDIKPYLLEDLIKNLKEFSYDVISRKITHDMALLYVR